jgi:hypothetical protein
MAAVTTLVSAELFFKEFSVFKFYDDIGYVMMSLKTYRDGYPLYDAVYTQYGPAYYVVRDWLYGPLTITHDLTALVSVAHAVLCCVFLGAIAYRLTANTALALLTVLISAGRVGPFLEQAGHPQEFVALLAVLAVFAAGWPNHPRLKAGVLGILIGAALLTKINVGFFILVPFLFYYAAEIPHPAIRRAITVALSAGAVAAPLLLTLRNISTPWVLYTTVLLTASLIPLVWLLTWPTTERTYRNLGSFGAALAVTVAAVIWYQIDRGASPAGLWRGIVTQHLHFADAYTNPFPLRALHAVLAVGSAILFVLVRSKRLDGRAVYWMTGAYAIVLPLLLAIPRGRVFAGFFVPFAWLASYTWSTTLTTTDDSQPQQSPDTLRYASLISLVAVYLLLQTYPVAGTQVFNGTVMFPVLAAMAIAGVSRSGSAVARAWKTWRMNLLLPAALCVGTAAYVGILARNYALNEPANLPGMSLYRLPDLQVAKYHWLVSKLKPFDTFVSMPGLNSLYFWTGKTPPSTYNVGAWMMLLDSSTQQEMVQSLGQFKHLGAVRSRDDATWWVDTRDISRKPLVAFINSQMHTTARYNEYELLERVTR